MMMRPLLLGAAAAVPGMFSAIRKLRLSPENDTASAARGGQASFTINYKNITNQGGCKGNLRMRQSESKATRKSVKKAAAEHNALIVKERAAASERVFMIIPFSRFNGFAVTNCLACALIDNYNIKTGT